MTALSSFTGDTPSSYVPPKLPERVSYSMLSSFASCKLKWYEQYVLRRPSRKSVFAYLGNVVHDTISRVHKNEIPVDLDLIRADFLESWSSQRSWGRGIFVPWEEIDWGLSPGVNTIDRQRAENAKFKAHGIRLLEGYFGGPHRRNTPMLTDVAGEPVLMSEFQIETDIEQYGGRRLKTLIGILDLVTEDARLLDFKTKFRKRLTQRDYKYHLQPTIYAFLLDESSLLPPPLTFKYGQLVYPDYEYDESIGGRIKPFKVDVMRQLVLPGMIRNVEEALDRIVSYPDHARWFQENLQPSQTGCLYCDVGDDCPFFKE